MKQAEIKNEAFHYLNKNQIFNKHTCIIDKNSLCLKYAVKIIARQRKLSNLSNSLGGENEKTFDFG